MDENQILEERKEKVIKFFKENPVWIFYLILFVLVILGIYIRYLPLSNHSLGTSQVDGSQIIPSFWSFVFHTNTAFGGQPGLWDVTTSDYTLGPDLDPFLFLRYAKTMIASGSLPRMDALRNVPLGFDTTTELQMVPYMIVLTYKFVNVFGNYSANFAGAFMPVLFFALTILSFFFFVREIFIRKDDKESAIKANIIASISTLFMIIMPGFLSRTVAGIPEKESVGFFFMFLAFYFFVKAWKSEKLRNATILGILSGISTALMGLSWGGVIYIYATMAIASLAAIVLNKVHKKEAIVYASWIIVSLLMTLLFTNRFSLKGYLTSLDTGLVVINLIVIGLHFLIWKTKIHEKLKLDRINLPKPIISFILSFVIIVIIASIVLGPSFIIDKLNSLNQMLISPIQGRWGTTVAENRQPYFAEWVGTFGKFVFWAFILGSIWMFHRMLNKSKKKQSLILTACYVFFLFGLIFSRYAPSPALFDGEGILSKGLYYGSFFLLACMFGYYYLKNHKHGDNSLESIDFEYILLFSLLVITLLTTRSAVRFIMVLVPIVPIFLAYLVTEISFKAIKEEDKNLKWIFVTVAIFLLIFSAYQAYGFYKQIKSDAYNFVPSYYTVQWQKAMSWVRDTTPLNSVFAHWWDYGYWVQSIGNRATVTDGGNVIVWWNYLTGRFVLTNDNQKEALDFLYAHNATHLLIDPTDIGKYGAYAQIGSNETFDRLSQGPFALSSDDRNIQETKNETIRIYNRPYGTTQVSIFPIEEDVVYGNNGTKIHLLKENTGLIGVTLNYSSLNNSSPQFNQPQAIFISGTGSYTYLSIRYLKYQDKFYDFGLGIEAGVSIVPRVTQTGVDYTGSLIYLSPRVFRGMVGQLYILDDPLKRFSNFHLAHSEQNLIMESLDQQGAKLGDFAVVLDNLQGPIKIWNITYTGNEKLDSEYLLKSPPDSITWKF